MVSVFKSVCTNYMCAGRWPDVPEYNYKELLARMKFRHTLAPHTESVRAMEHVRAECNRVSFNMCLFYVPTPKPLRLEDFEQSQSQATAHVSHHFLSSWASYLTEREREREREGYSRCENAGIFRLSPEFRLFDGPPRVILEIHQNLKRKCLCTLYPRVADAASSSRDHVHHFVRFSLP